MNGQSSVVAGARGSGVNPTRFVTELKRRNVYRAAVAYGVVAWFLTQFTTQIFPFFEVPNSAVRFVVIALAVGFPIAMLLSWLYELTPEGIVRTENLDPVHARSVQRATGRILDFIIIGVLLLVIAMLMVGQRPFYRQPGESISQKSIAVLPFENRSEDKANAYFADGIQDEILTRLSKIADLKVISRTSTQHYKTAPENLAEIAKQLGVANVLEGSVQRSGNRVRVNAQLVDARTDAHLWAQTYDRDLADVFAIQSEIAKAIAVQLQAKLSPNEKKAIEQPPTTDLAAFDLYSRAKSLVLTASFSVTNEPDLRKAIELLDEAVKRDPSFFDAYCQLAYAHESLYALRASDHTPARLALAEAAVQAATRLRPDAAETHLARAQYLYNGLRDYTGALAELEIARRALPNDPRLFELTGYILRRRGQQEEGLQNLQRAAELDPRNFDTLQQIALSYLNFWRYAESIAALDRALAIVPDNVETQANRELWYMCWKADTRPLRQTIDAILAQGAGAIVSAADIWFIALWPNAIRLRPNEHSSRWATIHAGAKTGLF